MAIEQLNRIAAESARAEQQILAQWGGIAGGGGGNGRGQGGGGGHNPVMDAIEATAVANMVQLMVNAMDARQADEGRSFFSKPDGKNKLGDKVVDQRVTIVSDPSSPEAPASAFNGAGFPNRRMVWLENGTQWFEARRFEVVRCFTSTYRFAGLRW
jgi:hypothetical protein